MIKNEQQNNIAAETEDYVRKVFLDEGTGHDWWHIARVRNLALKIAEVEGGNLFIIEMAALLHDLDDWKLTKKAHQQTVHQFLTTVNLAQKEVLKITEIIDQVSFKGASVYNNTTSKEADVVQDADRLDAIGAIGIARAFAYGGSKGRLIYDPKTKPEKHSDFESYKKGTAPTINHFYEKLLLLKDRLNTDTAKKIARKRHQFIENFLEQFFDEWENKL